MKPPERTPTTIAIERLAKLSGQGASPAKMIAALEGVLVAWGGEELEPDLLRERVEILQTDLDAGAQAAEDYLAEADTDAGRTAARKQLDGLQAARDHLSSIIAD